MDMHALAREIAEASIVLLKNEDELLPLSRGQSVAFFGRTQLDTIYSGNGSGATMTTDRRCILYACEEAGLLPSPSLKAWYEEQNRLEKELPKPGIDWNNAWELVHSGEMYELFGKYQSPLPEYIPDRAHLTQARADTDTALLVLGRNAGGEECDRHLEGDYLLTAPEKALVKEVCGLFDHVVLVLNVNGPIDLAWTEDYAAIRAILFVGIPGEGGAEALACVLTGEVNPSGKLAMTFACQYEDYPSAAHFSYEKERVERVCTYADYGLNAWENGSVGFDLSPVTVYAEDCFMGYRGFDSFDVEPLFPFGFGLSYTRFEMNVRGAEKLRDGVRLRIAVRNIGGRAGREVAQVYVMPYGCESARPTRELAGFAKTSLLQPGEGETLSLHIPWRALACYHEPSASWRVEQGAYVLTVGDSSRRYTPSVRIDVPKPLLMEQCENLLAIRESNRCLLDFRSVGPRPLAAVPDCPWSFTLPELACLPRQPESPTAIPTIVRAMSIEELAALCVGYGPGIPFSAFADKGAPETILDAAGKPITVNSHPTGMSGYVSPAMPGKGICSISYQDGPAGVGGIAWPTAMLMACAFDEAVWYAFGDAAGRECEERNIDVWLAPAVNLQRHPLCGRNFEYFSEDPLLTGKAACAIARGAQENHSVRVCPKHFAMNEQETFRRGSARGKVDAVDSIVTERAARELYLHPFEMLVRQAGVSFIMTSFNKINGVFAGGSVELCTRLLRDEWGFHGIVITDWGDMDTVVDGADAVAAGNDVIMPGGPPVIAQILKGFREGRLTRAQLETAVAHLLCVLRPRKAG